MDSHESNVVLPPVLLCVHPLSSIAGAHNYHLGRCNLGLGTVYGSYISKCFFLRPLPPLFGCSLQAQRDAIKKQMAAAVLNLDGRVNHLEVKLGSIETQLQQVLLVI